MWITNLAGNECPSVSLASPSVASTEETTLFQQARSGFPVNRAVHPTTTEQTPIGRVDNDIHMEIRNVATDDFNSTECAHWPSSRFYAAKRKCLPSAKPFPTSVLRINARAPREATATTRKGR